MYETALKILKKLDTHGFKAYIVGGYVRDKLLGIKSLDVDIATSATPKEIMEIFNTSALPNEEYGAVTLFMKNERYELTTFRREIRYINNRKPVEIEYIDDLLEDLKRRDFNMNTLCIDKDGNIIDFLGGKEDIDNKIINTVGDSNFKFNQDSLRILRAIRFATMLDFKLSEDVKKSIINNKDGLKTLSYNRKKQELDKIFTSTNSKYGIALLKELCLDDVLELKGLENVKPNSDLLGIWASLNIANGYQFSSNEREIIKHVKAVLKEEISNETLYKYGLYVNQLAADIKGQDKAEIAQMYENLPITSRKNINITSEEIMQILNIKPGPLFKEIYDKLENKILNGHLDNNNEHIKEFIVANYS